MALPERVLDALEDRRSPFHRSAEGLVRHLYGRLEALCGGSDALFAMWRRELAFVYGDPDRRSLNKSGEGERLALQYGLPGTPDMTRLLMVLQTLLSLTVRLLTLEELGWRRGEKGETPGGRTFFEALYNGAAFRDLGVENFCGEDWTSWPVKYWDDRTEALFDGFSRALGDLSDGGGPHREGCSDGFRRLYETVLPKELRHALGEFYTPMWLAEWGLRNALEACGKERPRVLDPTCGAGTFLVPALRQGVPLSDVAGFDINALAVLTARANLLLALEELPERVRLPVYHYDVLRPPVLRDGTLEIDTGCGFRCGLSGELLPELAACPPDAEGFLRLIKDRDPALFELFAGFDGVNARVLAGLVLDCALGFLTPRADAVVGNPPWVSWEYLPREYRDSTAPLWTEYGLFDASGLSRSFAKEDEAVLITCAVLERHLSDGGTLSFLLRAALFQASRNGGGFRRFRLPGGPFRVLRVDDLGDASPFDGVVMRAALVLIRKGEEHRFPVPFTCWTAGRGSRKALRKAETREQAEEILHKEEFSAIPAEKNDPASVWVRTAPEGGEEACRVLGSNGYRARTGVFTGGANAVYWLRIMGREGDLAAVRNVTDRAKRAAPQVEALLERDHLYPLVRGGDLGKWRFSTECAILCPHTAETKLRPVPPETLQRETPRTWDYLASFKRELTERRGFAGWERAIQQESFYAVLRVGAYTFAPWKVAWRYIAKRFETAVIGPAEDPVLGRKPCLPNEKLVFVGLEDGEEAYYLCGLLSSSPVRRTVERYMNPTSVSAHVLDKLNLPQYDPADPLHRRIAALCREGHETPPEGHPVIQEALDEAARALYGLASEEE